MDKLRSLADLARECESWRSEGKTIVWTNGCFDLFHAGHARALTAARELGDVLIVGINSDRSVRELKGSGRPIISGEDRAAMLSALEAVDRVVVFDGKRCDREISAIRPHFWAKSGDYTPDSLDPDERAALEAGGGKTVITPLIPGISTTLLVDRIRRLDPEKIVSAACALIRDGEERLLMVATRYTDAIRWSLPGGGHRHGETLAETAKRETREETGLEVAVGDHLSVLERIAPDTGLHLAMHVFTAHPVPGGTIKPLVNSAENIVEAAWFTRERLREETGIVLGRRLWLEYWDKPGDWPSYILMKCGEE